MNITVTLACRQEAWIKHNRYHLCLRVSRICQEMVLSADTLAVPSITVTLNSRYQLKPYALLVSEIPITDDIPNN
jgi:hypothetical protein